VKSRVKKERYKESQLKQGDSIASTAPTLELKGGKREKRGLGEKTFKIDLRGVGRNSTLRAELLTRPAPMEPTKK